MDTTRPRILVDMSLHPRARAALTAAADVAGLPRDGDARAAALAGADGILAYGPPAPTELASAPHLRALAVHLAAPDVHAYAAEQGVAVIESSRLWRTVAEHTLALLLATLRRVPAADAAIRAGRWPREDLKVPYSGRDLARSTVGVLGAGRIGAPLLGMLAALEARPLFMDATPMPDLEAATGARQVDLDALLAESDAVVVLLPLDEATRGTLGAAELARMKPDAVLVNTARGPVVDEDALLAALRDGTLAGAGLDVHGDEPLPADHPLLAFEQVVITPHLGGSTLECDLELVDGLLRALGGGAAPPA
ncbi:NAD(P)-dependent oxidoreductase [Demequina mangrovi]|uniref:Glyoxylate reductase/gluconate 2-dehydrogenase n=1 Tax=Demequina mangrovi TaxID=1043493 RepID=A0A1H7AF05_9MICO|nr:NAD(P)-dependent oxidoreductase [Demequina mangrovi]SEJ64211.1 glyoxylate reductase/gluconate 2-dehydrogenase [Demequina mangrovi]